MPKAELEKLDDKDLEKTKAREAREEAEQMEKAVGTVLPPETKSEKQATPVVAGTVPDFIRWVNDKNAVPVLFAWEAEHYETFYDGRVNQWLRILDGKPVDEKPEKKGHVYHKPIIVPIPFDPDSSSLPSELLPLLVRESAIWKHPAFYDFSTRYWKVLTPKLWQKFQILPRNYSAWLKQWWGLASEDGDEDESEDES